MLALKDHPVLRERLLGLTAIGAILIGGVIGVDTMVTGGWQFGGDQLGAAPAIYADATPRYQDDTSRDWSATPPQRVAYASNQTRASPQISHDLEGQSAGEVAATSVAPTEHTEASRSDHSSPDWPQQDAAALNTESQGANRRFNAIEADIAQANAPVAPESPAKEASDSNN